MNRSRSLAKKNKPNVAGMFYATWDISTISSVSVPIKSVKYAFQKSL